MASELMNSALHLRDLEDGVAAATAVALSCGRPLGPGAGDRDQRPAP